jgi:hypothetical protein
MPAITATDMTGAGKRAVTVTTLNGTDSLTYTADKAPVLILRNDTGSPVSPVIEGADATTEAVAGIGAVDVSGGYAVGSIADGAEVAVPLRSIAAYLVGAVTITSGSGLDAVLLEF